MYRVTQQQLNRKTTLKGIKSYEGETIEEKVMRITSNKEPIKDNAPLVYTDRKDGVRPEYDIRTDRFEVAIDAMDKVAKSHKASREQRIGERTFDTMTKEQQSEFNKKFPNNKFAKLEGQRPASGDTGGNDAS